MGETARLHSLGFRTATLAMTVTSRSAPDTHFPLGPEPLAMASWTVYCLECADDDARESLMDRFEREHPVTFPSDRYSVVAAVEVGDGPVEADFAWVGQYLYVTTTESADDLALETVDDWERAAIGAFDASDDVAEQVTLVLDADAGTDDEVAGGRFRGVEGLGGMDVLYSLAMRHQFRFRSYSAVPPASHTAPHPDAFTVVDAVETFAGDMAAATDVEPTDEGLAFLRSDPAAADRYVFGETYGPVDQAFGAMTSTVADPAVRADEDLPVPEDVLDPDERPDVPSPEADCGLFARLRRLFGR